MAEAAHFAMGIHQIIPAVQVSVHRFASLPRYRSHPRLPTPVYHATGKRVRDLPVTLEKLL